MEKKIKLEIVGLSYSQTQTGAYALVLGEVGAKRRLPVIIGNFEAQAIAIELENMKPSRPLTHDIFKNLATSFEIDVKEVIIYNLVEGVFYAKIICESAGKAVEIDARTSDAIALAVRFKCEIFTFEFILEKAGILLEEEQDLTSIESDDDEPEELSTETNVSMKDLSLDELEQLIEEAIANEDYERASKIRDEINKRK
jgi:bifunctional DNase/RNase